MRLAVAQVLRVVEAISLGLALCITVVTLVSAVLMIAGTLELAPSYGLGELLLSWLATTALLAAIGRVAHLAIAAIVDT